MKVTCDYCKKETEKRTGHYNRSMKLGLKVFCGRECFGLDKRKSIEEKKKTKAEYDKKWKTSLAGQIYSCLLNLIDYENKPEKYRAIRQNRMKKHIEYCRQPKYKAYKKKYDKTYRAKKLYGEWGEAAIILMQLENEIDNRLAKQQNNLINKSQKRKRRWQQQTN